MEILVILAELLIFALLALGGMSGLFFVVTTTVVALSRAHHEAGLPQTRHPALPDPVATSGDDLAAGLGFERVEGGLDGAWRGYRVALRRVLPTDTFDSSRLTLTLHGANPRVSIRRASRNPTHMGDPAFDAEVRAQGDPMHLLAALDSRGRDAVRRALRLAPFRVEGGAVTLHIRKASWPTPEWMGVYLDAIAALAEALEAPADPRAALHQRALFDPLPGVRERALEAVSRSFGAHDTIVAALADSDPRVQLTAARLAHHAGVAVAIAGDPRVPAPLRLDALRLALELDRTRADDADLDAAILSMLADRETLEVALAAGTARQVPGLARRLAEHADTLGLESSALGRRVADRLRALGDPWGVPVLLRLLRSSRPEVRVGAAKALGAVGGVDVVPHLAPLAAMGDRLSTDPLPSVARDAVRQIQSRAAGERGGLALTDDAGGALSLSSSGRLSVVAPPERS